LALRRERRALARFTLLTLAGRTLLVWVVLATLLAGVAHADLEGPRAVRWSGGAGVGFLANTPDGPEFGLMAHGDYFLASRLSVGPLVQYGGVGNDVVAAMSVQARYWWSIFGGGKSRVVLQGGLGVILADITDADTGAADSDASFVIPLGIGLDYAVTPRVAVTADFILNVTSLGEVVSAGGHDVDLHTNLVPGFFLGVRF
jgi:hypothetical protein